MGSESFYTETPGIPWDLDQETPVPDVQDDPERLVLDGTTITSLNPPTWKVGDILELNGIKSRVTGIQGHETTLTYEVFDWTWQWKQDNKLRAAQPTIRMFTGRRSDRRQQLVKSFKEPLRYPLVRGCGHKFIELQQPRHRNCESCWNSFFFNQKELTENIAKNVTEQGPEVVGYVHGRKFLTHFLRFATLLVRYEQFKQQTGRSPEDVSSRAGYGRENSE